MDQKPEVQRMYLELQMITAQIKDNENQMQQLEEQLVGIALSKQSLEDFSSVKKDREILVPITNGVFAKARLEENNELLVNVGTGVVVKKTVEDSKKIIEKQFVEIQKMQRQLLSKVSELSVKAQRIEREISKLVK